MTLDAADYRGRLLIADGDFAGEFSLRGWRGDLPTESANLARPDIVRDVADAFLDAGAHVLVTCTAAAHALAQVEGSRTAGAKNAAQKAKGKNKKTKGHSNGSEDLAAVNRQGAAICRAAVSEHPGTGRLVFGAMGPTDRLLMLNEVSQAELYDAYCAQAEALADGGVDAILCCSFTEIEALCVAVRAAIETTGLAVIGSMTFDSGPQQTETALGVTVPQACAALVEAGATLIGCDCGENPDALPAVVSLMRQSSSCPIWVKVNAGTPQLAGGRVVYLETPETFAQRLAPLFEAGANFVGGCCGATVDHIAALARARGVAIGEEE